MSVVTVAGIILKVFTPDWSTGTLDPFAETFDDTLGSKVSAYSHTHLANGGCDIANFAFSENLFRANDWYKSGIGKILLTTDEIGSPRWLGVINRITFIQGGLTSVIGPLMDIRNDVLAIYTPIFADTNPMIKGATRFTTIVQDAESIAKYGLHMGVFNAGEALVDATYNEAEQARDTFLRENAYPSDDEQSIQFQSAPISIAVECVGLKYYLEKYYFNDPTTGVTTISGTPTSKLETVLAAEPNGIIVTEDFEANPVLTHSLEDQSRTGQSIISELLTSGGATFDRWTFGIYADQTAKFKPMPTEPAYTLRQGEGQNLLSYNLETEVRPWEILPAQWVVLKNAFEGEPGIEVGPDSDDRRAQFIEQVTYTAPYNFSLGGAKIGRLSQMIARMGLKGIT